MKKVIIQIVSVALFAVSLQSCGTNEDYLSSTDEVYYSNKFQVFTQPNENGTINYPDGFAFLLKEYDKLYKTNFTGLKSFENKGSTERNSISERHIDFDMRSQPMKSNDNVWVYFPVVENGKVVDVAIGILQDEETYVQFGILNQKDEYNQLVLKEFRTAYLKKNISVFNKGKEDPPPCGTSGNPCDTGEVIITPPRGPKLPIFDIGVYPGEGGGGGGGGCETFNNCGGPPRGGGGVPPKPKDPCEKTKGMLDSQKNKDITNDLKNHMESGAGGEKGWRDNKTGAPTQTTQNGDHSVNFGDPSTMNGGYHNHTGTTVDMFSATDIDTFLDIVRYQNVGNTGNAYFGMVAPNSIHYIMYFNGSHTDLPPAGDYSEVDIAVWNLYIIKNAWNILNRDTSGTYCNILTNTLNSKGLEKIFFDTVKKMGLTNKITLQKVEPDNKASTVNQNPDGTITNIPCP
ncbi:hypothetical protein [Chryseobacterium artocarpi]|uniref:hypothetical protein n=1 Tax=Chryseobacterium artocarpi TaxID=1414727 RepID=UPI003F3077C6